MTVVELLMNDAGNEILLLILYPQFWRSMGIISIDLEGLPWHHKHIRLDRRAMQINLRRPTSTSD